MTEKGVKGVIGKLVTDNNFQKEFFKDPHATIEESGFHISEKERNILVKIKPSDLQFNIGSKLNEVGKGVVIVGWD